MRFSLVMFYLTKKKKNKNKRKGKGNSLWLQCSLAESFTWVWWPLNLPSLTMISFANLLLTIFCWYSVSQMNSLTCISLPSGICRLVIGKLTFWWDALLFTFVTSTKDRLVTLLDPLLTVQLKVTCSPTKKSKINRTENLSRRIKQTG